MEGGKFLRTMSSVTTGQALEFLKKMGDKGKAFSSALEQILNSEKHTTILSNVEGLQQETQFITYLQEKLAGYGVNVEKIVKILAENGFDNKDNLKLVIEGDAWKQIEGLCLKDRLALEKAFK